MGIIRWEEPPEEYYTPEADDIIEELSERPDAYALVLEGQPLIVSLAFAKELEIKDVHIETVVVGRSVYARWRI